MKTNAELLRRTLAHIEANPGSWRQAIWRNDCGTAACFAGWAATLAGAAFDPDDAEYVDADSLPPDVRDALRDYYQPYGGLSALGVHIADAAALLLGLVQTRRDATGCIQWDMRPASRLFSTSNTLDDLRRIVGELCAAAESAGAPHAVEGTA